MPLEAPQPLTEQHRTAGFDSGDSSLNQWIEQRALANQRSGTTRTFVVCDGDGVVKAYVALASGAVAVSASPGRFRRNMPDPIPVVVLADVFERVLQASEQIGVRGILVHAASAAARSVYLHVGFDPSPRDPNTFLLRLVDVKAALNP
jgi:hypothetical protein